MDRRHYKLRSSLYRVTIQHEQNANTRLVAYALLTITPQESWIPKGIRIRVKGQVRFEYVLCGYEHFEIFREIVADSKRSGYMWMGGKWQTSD